MTKLLLKGGRVVDPATGLDKKIDILIAEGDIAEIGDKISASDAEVVDCSGKVVTPGLVDLHCELREPGNEESETIETGASAAARGGFTTIYAMPNTKPCRDNVGAVQYVNALARQQVNCKVKPVGAVTKAMAGEELAEIGEMAERGVTLVSDANTTILNSKVMRRAMEYASTFGIKMISHCEDLNLTKNGTANEGIMTARLGFRVMPSVAEEAMVYRDLRLAEYLGLPLHIGRISSMESVRLIREAKERSVPVTCDVTIQHLVLNEESLGEFNTNFKLNPPLRSEADRQALIEALADGTIDAIVSDHSPFHIDYKNCEFDIASFGVSSLETTLALALDKLVHPGLLSWSRLVEAMSMAPATIGTGDASGLGTGSAADLTIIDPESTWTVDPKQFLSKGRNTPYAGMELKGKAFATVVDGVLIS